MTDEPQTDVTEQEPRQPTAEETQQIQAVGAAGVQAAQKGEDPQAAMREARDRVNAPMSDADIERVADQFFGKFETLMRESGALDPPVEPVRAPEPAIAPPAPGEDQETTPEPAAPAKRAPSLAARFFGET